MEIEVNRNIFNEKYYPVYTYDHRYIYMWGGGSSGKSYSIAQILTLKALQGEAVLVARDTQVSIMKSVWLEFANAISTMGLNKYFVLNKTDRTIISMVSSGSIQMVGCDNEDRVKSIRPVKQTAFSKLWIEEVNEVSKSMMAQLNIRMRGATPQRYPKQAIYSWNPTYSGHYLNTDILDPNGVTDDNTTVEFETIDSDGDTVKHISIHSNYTDNRFLTEDDIKGLKSLEQFSPYHYRVYGLGRWGVLGDRIFEDIKQFNIQELEYKKMEIYGGLDFGWNDPTALSIMAIDRAKRDIYIIGGFCKSKLDAVKMDTQIGIEYERLGLSKSNILVFGDSEDPRLITQLKQLGHAIRDAKKPAGSVLAGIMLLGTYTIHIEQRLKKHIEAFENYAWDIDKKTGSAIDRPNHNFSHIPDSARYGMEIVFKSGGVVGRQVKY